jgi:hypothetical protein
MIARDEKIGTDAKGAEVGQFYARDRGEWHAWL